MSGDFNDRETLLTDLRVSAETLLQTSDTAVANQIEAAIEEVEAAWNETCENLRELYTKYKKAVVLWQEYSEASGSVKLWLDEQMLELDSLNPSFEQLKVCQCENK